MENTFKLSKDSLAPAGVEALSIAIIEQAAKDYKEDVLYLRKKLKNPVLKKLDLKHIKDHYDDILMIRRFFNDQYGPNRKGTCSLRYNMLTNSDGGRILDTVEREDKFSEIEPLVKEIVDLYIDIIQNKKIRTTVYLDI